MRILKFSYFMFLGFGFVLTSNVGWAVSSDHAHAFNGSTIMVMGPPLESFLQERQGLGGNPNQYAVTMTQTVTNVRKLVVSEYNDTSCADPVAISATMTAAQDETFSTGNTYAATDASSWAMVQAAPIAWYNPACIKYDFQDSSNNSLHSRVCTYNWYASGLGSNNYCVSGTCGQSLVCTDTW